MARYETYHSTAPQASLMRKWFLRALFLSLALHGGLFVFFQVKKLENFTLGDAETLAPPTFVLKKATIDPKSLQDPEEVKTTLQDKPKPITKIDVPVEKIEATEITIKPSNPEIVSALLTDKPKATPLNTDLVAKAEANSAGALDKQLGSIASDLLKESVRNPKQAVVFTLPKGSKEMGGGLSDNEGIPGLRSLDDAISATGPLAAGDRLGMRGGALFDYDRAELVQRSIDDLQKLGAIIQRNAKATFIIEGHTDSFGNPTYNIDLSQRRADAVKAWLVTNMGISPERVLTIGYGSEKPIAPVNGSIEEQAPNRRVEIVIKTNRAR